MHTRKTQLIFLFVILISVVVTVSAQEGVQNLAVVVNALTNPEFGVSTSLSIVDLDEPDVEKAVENRVIPLGSAPSDVEIQGDFAYVVNTLSHSIQIVDLRNRASVGAIRIGDGTQPQQIAFIDQSKAYVTCDGTNEIRVVDLRERSVINTIPGGLKPTGITVLNGKAYVTNAAFIVDPTTFAVTYEDSSVTVIDTRTDTVLKTISAPTNATGITTDGESKVLVLSVGDFNLIPGELMIIDAGTDEVEKTVKLRTTPGFSLIVNSMKHIFMNDGFLNRGLLVYDLATEKWIHDRNDALADFARGWGLAIGQNDNVYVAIPDWTGANQDELRVMAPDETLIRTYRVGNGASLVAVGQVKTTDTMQFDLSTDGVVDIADLVFVAARFGETGVGIAADVNRDGTVDIVDLVLVATHFGETVVAAPFHRPSTIDNRQLSIANSEPHYQRIQRAIVVLESYPDQSSTIRLVTDLLRRYIAKTVPTVTETKLFANYPNPFNPETWIPFQLSAGSPVVIRIYDGSGQLVRTLDLGHRRAGVYTSKSQAGFWDGKNEFSGVVTSGVYFYQLLTSRAVAVRKMVVLK